MSRRWAYLLVGTMAALPGPASGQWGVGVRAGTLGVGPELAADLSEMVVLRGGVGFNPLEPEVRMNGMDWRLELPSHWYHTGLDLYLNRAFRIGGGVLFKGEDPRIVGLLGATNNVGGQTFTADELGSLIGTVDSTDRRPYAVLGFGRQTVGSGLYLDLGVVWMGDPAIRLESVGGAYADQATLDARLQQAERDVQADLGTYLKAWLIMSLGARIAIS